MKAVFLSFLLAYVFDLVTAFGSQPRNDLGSESPHIPPVGVPCVADANANVVTSLALKFDLNITSCDEVLFGGLCGNQEAKHVCCKTCAGTELELELQGVKDAVDSVGGWVETAVDDVGNWVETAVDDAGNWVETAVDDVGDWVENDLVQSDFADAMIDSTSFVWGIAAPAFTTAAAAFSGAVLTTADFVTLGEIDELGDAKDMAFKQMHQAARQTELAWNACCASDTNWFKGARTSNHNNWMQKEFSGGWGSQVKVRDMFLPGTHDTLSFHGGDIAQTQTWGLVDQLNAGLRVLDIRLNMDSSSKCMDVYHGPVYQRTDWEKIVQKLQNWITANPGEFVIVMVKKEGDGNYPCNNHRDVFSAARAQSNVISKNWKFVDQYSSFKDNTYNDLRGNLVLVNHIENSGRGYNVQNEYEIDDGFDAAEIKYAHVSRHARIASIATSELFVNFLSAYGSVFMNTPDKIAYYVNKEFMHNIVQKDYGPGIYLFDFPGQWPVDRLIQRNVIPHNCWSRCNSRSGPCSTCGPGMGCCQKGFNEDHPLCPEDQQVQPFHTCTPLAVIKADDRGWSGCTPTNRCGVGGTDCDADADCQPGLMCFQRDNIAHNPPFVDGSNVDGKFDICYDPRARVVADDKGSSGCTSTRRCGVGGADCDNDNDCEAGLECYQRSHAERHPPGVDGSTANRHHDICYDPATAYTVGGVNRGPSGCTSTRRCGVGGADCDNDNDCQPGLKCFQRNSGSSNPKGVDGSRIPGDYDICYDPSWG